MAVNPCRLTHFQWFHGLRRRLSGGILLSWHHILISVRKSEATVGSGCPVPFKLERQANLPSVVCTFRWSKTDANQRKFQTLFNCIKLVRKRRKDLEDWLLFFHRNLQGQKVEVSVLYYHPVMESQPVLHWNMNECCPSSLLTLDRKGHQPVMSSIIVYLREFQ